MMTKQPIKIKQLKHLRELRKIEQFGDTLNFNPNMQKPTDLIYGAFIDKTLVAFLYATLNPVNQYRFIEYLYVAPPYRGKYISFKLYKHLLSRAKIIAIETLIKETNKTSRAIAERVGFLPEYNLNGDIYYLYNPAKQLTEEI